MKTLGCLLLLASLAFEMLAEAFPRSSDRPGPRLQRVLHRQIPLTAIMV